MVDPVSMTSKAAITDSNSVNTDIEVNTITTVDTTHDDKAQEDIADGKTPETNQIEAPVAPEDPTTPLSTTETGSSRSHNSSRSRSRRSRSPEPRSHQHKRKRSSDDNSRYTERRVDYEQAENDRTREHPDQTEAHEPTPTLDYGGASAEAANAPGSASQGLPVPGQDTWRRFELSGGWEYRWDLANGACWYFNRATNMSQWDPPAEANPVPGTNYNVTTGNLGPPPGLSGGDPAGLQQYAGAAGGYNPKIHGDWDPNADYASAYHAHEAGQAAFGSQPVPAAAADGPYEAAASFNRFTGRFQQQGGAHDPERHGDEAKSNRQMNAYFDVDKAANSHDGRSLKAERRNQHLTRQQIEEFKGKKKEQKSRKQRDWLMS